MSIALVRAARWTAISAGVIGYAVLAHFSAVTSAATSFPAMGVAVSLAPSLGLLLLLAWRSPRRLAMVLLCASVGFLLWGYWGTLERNFSRVYFLQHAGTNVMLAALFGVSLARGRQPLCSRFAEVVHGGLTSELVRYTRQVTLAWTLFFVAESLASTLLFLLAPIKVWSVFANFLTLPLVLLMFAAEYRVRLRKLPQLDKHSITDGMLSYWKPAATPPAASPHTR